MLNSITSSVKSKSVIVPAGTLLGLLRHCATPQTNDRGDNHISAWRELLHVIVNLSHVNLQLTCSIVDPSFMHTDLDNYVHLSLVSFRTRYWQQEGKVESPSLLGRPTFHCGRFHCVRWMAHLLVRESCILTTKDKYTNVRVQVHHGTQLLIEVVNHFLLEMR